MTMELLENINLWTLGQRAALRGVFADIDDTMTTAGRIPSAVFAAMENLQAAGILVVPITGRPAGWCDMIARTWPIDAVVGENGAFYFRYTLSSKKMVRRYIDSEETRIINRLKLDALAAEITRAIPAAAIASDQAYRAADLAVDFCEDVDAIPLSEINRIVEIFKQHGATAKVSSIHVNGWYGDYDKLTMTRILMEEEYGIALSAELDRYAFIGDSPNDAPMFSFFPNAVAVANYRQFADQSPAHPAFITTESGGAGFVEFANAILVAR